MFKHLLSVALLAIGPVLPAGAVAQPPAARQGAADVVSRMFTWWNGAIRTPDGFNREGFARYFTEDATLTLNGNTAIRGLDQWVTHFRGIQAATETAEIVVPFKTVFTSGSRIYTYHVIRSRRNGVATCMLAAGHADLRDGKIAALTLVRATLNPQRDAMDPACSLA